MRLMGLMPIYQKPRTSIPHPEHRRYPYLLRDMTITGHNQVWCADISVPQKAAYEMRVWPLAIGLQELMANHHERRWSKAGGVSVMERPVRPVRPVRVDGRPDFTAFLKAVPCAAHRLPANRKAFRPEQMLEKIQPGFQGVYGTGASVQMMGIHAVAKVCNPLAGFWRPRDFGVREIAKIYRLA
jgi:hypothetical protein